MDGCVFYSTKCKTKGNNMCLCYKVMKFIEQNGLNRIFKFISVDNMKPIDIQKNNLSVVPTMIVRSRESTSVFEGIKCLEWLTFFLSGKKNSTPIVPQNNNENQQQKKIIQSTNMMEKVKDQLHEYCPNEQNNISDSYSLWRDDVNKDLNIPLPQSFGKFDKDATPESIVTVPIGSTKEYKAKEGLSAVYGSDLTKIITQKQDERAQFANTLKCNAETEALNILIANRSQ
jgi:hypothetical protein